MNNANDVPTILLNGLIVAVVILNIIYIHFNLKLKRKIKEIGIDKGYIIHLENTLKEYKLKFEKIKEIKNVKCVDCRQSE